MAAASSCHDVVDRCSRRYADIATAPAWQSGRHLRCCPQAGAASSPAASTFQLTISRGLVEIRRPEGRGVPNAEQLVEACEGVGVADAGTAVEQGRHGLHELADYLQSLKPEGVV